MSSDDGISSVVDSEISTDIQQLATGLKHLPRWPPVNIEFQDIVYSVPDSLSSEYI